MPSEHGTRSRYNHGCRCSACRAANARYFAGRRSGKAPPGRIGRPPIAESAPAPPATARPSPVSNRPVAPGPGTRGLNPGLNPGRRRRNPDLVPSWGDRVRAYRRLVASRPAGSTIPTPPPARRFDEGLVLAPAAPTTPAALGRRAIAGRPGLWGSPSRTTRG